MHIQTLELQPATPGVSHSLQVIRFGAQGAGPKAYIQAALHADEVPAMLVARELKMQLEALEERGQIRGEVVLVPYANPIGLTQQMLGQHQGRFDLRNGGNFNRNYVDVTPAVAEHVRGSLGEDPQRNMRLVRDALRHAVRSLPGQDIVQDLKNRLLQLAVDSDIVLDMHCDHEAVMHLYALTPQSEQAVTLGALLGARAILLATESGDSPFDEACSRPWYALQRLFPDVPLPLGCFSATLELRGEADTDFGLAQKDAGAIVEFLRINGVLRGTPAELPQLMCAPTPLAGSEPVTATTAGVVVFHKQAGDNVVKGDLIAELVDPHTGDVTPVRCQSSGVFYARSGSRWALPGKRLGKIAGTSLMRTGKLLSP